ncbi:unnamed protein product [Microthlaspi erraticum]|uniref:Uncharacterized protein n=1 Tax=Microthlaspi erraticum TaxID=1685480 RepID=A0A6D2HYX9_9BRAS|nr:unnamed protein product [Microthlaspi erraticum]
MAISHVAPVLLLLASIFFLPFSRGIDFEYCHEGEDNIVNVTRMEIYPNPVSIGDKPTIWIFVSAPESRAEAIVYSSRTVVELDFLYEIAVENLKL